MAKGKNSTNKKKADKAKNSKPVKHDPTKDAPKIVAAKGGLSPAALLKETVFRMEDDLRVTSKQARDFADSMLAVIEEALENGDPVNLLGVVKLTPRFHTKGVREVREEFGNPESKLVKKKYPSKVSLKATVMKRAKDALPSAQKLAKKVGA